MGTRFFNSSMAYRHARNASSRCGADTAMATLASPMGTLPMRWTMAIRVIRHLAPASSPSRAISRSAMPG